MAAQGSFCESNHDPTHMNDALMDENNATKDVLSDKNMAAPSLTPKALFAGIVAGSFGSFIAIYNGLRVGIVPSLNIISALLGFFMCHLMVKVMGGSGVFTPQENVVIQTTAVACIQVASASGFSSGLLAMSPEAAKVTGPGQNPNDFVVLNYQNCLTFCCAIAFFGFWIAFPLRKYCIIDRKLQFPSGTATAKLIETMHSDYASAFASLVRLSIWTAITFAQNMLTYFFGGLAETPLGPLGKLGFSMDWDMNSMGIGMILPNSINASILLGGIIANAFIAPWVSANHECEFGHQPANDPKCWFTDPDFSTMTHSEQYAASYTGLRSYYFYPGCAMVVVDGFYSIFKMAFILIKSFRNKEQPDEKNEADDESNPAAARRAKFLDSTFMSSQFPVWMQIGGYCVSAFLAIILLHTVFDVMWYHVLLGVLLTPIFAVGIIVGVGMTDWDVSSAFGKLMMIPFGALAASQHTLIPSLATCMLTISGCGAAAGLMQDFKTGYLIGANPKTMFVAQIFGAVAGCFVAPGVFQIFNNAYTLPGPPSQAIPGIFGTSYRVLAGVFSTGGFSVLPNNSGYFILAFAILAVILNVLSDVLPERVHPYIPNAMAMSIGLMQGPGVGINFLLGGMAISIWRKFDPAKAEKFSVVVACGCMAGGALGQIVIILLQSAGISGLEWPVWPAGWQ